MLAANRGGIGVVFGTRGGVGETVEKVVGIEAGESVRRRAGPSGDSDPRAFRRVLPANAWPRSRVFAFDDAGIARAIGPPNAPRIPLGKRSIASAKATAR